MPKSRRRAALAAACLLASAAGAQVPGPPPVPPGACESPDEIAARVHYERALRAELDRRWDDARGEAEAVLQAMPSGPFAEAAQKMLARITAERQVRGEAPPAATGGSPRAELVTVSTIEGLVLGALLASAANADEKGTTALLMLGTGLGLGVSLAASGGGRHIPQSMPPMMELGANYGVMAALVGEDLGGGLRGNVAAPVALGMAGASALATAVSPLLTGGDAGAATAGFIYGSTLPILFEAGADPRSSKDLIEWSLLIGGTAGIPLGIVINRQANWSRARWNVISLGGGVGALFGAGTVILADAWKNDGRTGFLLTSAGAIAGLALTAWLTDGFGADEPRGQALLHLEPGSRLALGNVAASVGPLRMPDGRTGANLRVLDGRF